MKQRLEEEEQRTETALDEVEEAQEAKKRVEIELGSTELRLAQLRKRMGSMKVTLKADTTVIEAKFH